MSSLPTEPNPPFGVVVGAGVVGATAGQVVFKNPLISVGLGLGAMGLAATGEHSGGELARSSGRMALAAFERGNEVNQRYAFTDKIAQGLKTTLERAKHLDEEHHIVEKTRDRASHAFEQLKKFDEEHKVLSRAEIAITKGMDSIADALDPDTASRRPRQTRPGWK